jgi:hypothetical protein
MTGEPNDLTQMMELPKPFSQWTHYNPVLVETLAVHGHVPEAEVVDHLNELFNEAATNPDVRPLERQTATVQAYLNEYVAVG